MNTKNQYQTLLKDILKCLNQYSAVQNSTTEFQGYAVSAVDLQILSALLFNEKNQFNMITIAGELGIAASTFTKSVAKLTRMEFTAKYHKQGNRKDVVVVLSDTGKRFHAEISRYSTNWILQLETLIREKPERLQYYDELIQFMLGWMQIYNDGTRTDRLIPL